MNRIVAPLLMAVGVAIVGGVMLGINFPLGGQNAANRIEGNRTVIQPANVGARQSETVSQAPSSTPTTIAPANAPTQGAGTADTTTTTQTQPAATESNNEPVGGMW